MIEDPMLGGGVTTGSKEPYFTPTGFPFEDTDPTEFTRSRGSSFRSSPFRRHLDDLASRHPEFAEHLQPWATTETDFPSFRHNFERKRFPSGSSSTGAGDENFQSSTLGQTNIDSDKQENLNDNSNIDSKESTNKRQIPQYGLRNTVDLGQKQKQSSFDEESPRGQRSMSAPPDNRSNQPQQRFVSRVNIDPQPAPAAAAAATSSSMGSNSSSTLPKQQPSPQSQQQQKPNVRHIPIFVEGRDEPILPKNVDETDSKNPDSNYTHPSQQQHFFDQSTNFGGFRRESPRSQRREYPFTKQHQPQSHHQQQFFPQQQQQHHPQQQPPQPSPKPPQPQAAQPQVNLNDPIVKIQQIQKDVNDLMLLVEKYEGTSKKDKQYLYLDEMLTRNLLKLDNIETEGKDSIRQARKEAIKCIEKCISILESKVQQQSNEINSENTNGTENKSEVSSEPMEQEPAVTEDNKTVLQSETTVTEKESNENVQNEQMQTEPTEPPKQTLEIGGVAKSGIQVQNIENEVEMKEEAADNQKSPSKNNVKEQNETEKKKVKKSPKKKTGETKDKKVDENAITSMEVDEITAANSVNQSSPASNASQNLNQEATKIES